MSSEQGPDDITPEMQAALEALLSEPFPRKPYALVPVAEVREGVPVLSGGGVGHGAEFTDYIIHKDLDTEHQCVIVFDSIVDAFAVAEEFKTATGRDAEPVECDVYSLEEDRFWLKFYRANGVIAVLSLEDYKQHIGPSILDR